MSCILFHKWTKWSEPKFKDVVKINIHRESLEQQRRLIQERTCKRCGKYQWELIERN